MSCTFLLPAVTVVTFPKSSGSPPAVITPPASRMMAAEAAKSQGESRAS